LAGIREQAIALAPYEIIVVDHGSSDKTPKVAEGMGARVVVQHGGTVAAARNLGAKHATGSTLVFLDADVMLTPEWRMNIEPVFRALAENPMVLHGSWVGVGRPPSLIERLWFQPLERQAHSHVNSGHLIVSPLLFQKLRGFDERLETGEDYDFSQRVLALGGKICNNPALAVVHEGYPKTLSGFFKRELWHGRGDWVSPTVALRSRVVLLAMAVLALSIAAAGAVVSGHGWAALLAAFGAFGLCFAAAWKKFRSAPLPVLAADAALYYVYFMARAWAWLPPLVQSVGRNLGLSSESHKRQM
jgi:GT2 family glycosyltransferase